MNILTEKEREDVYKYWLSSSTLTNEDGLIQLAERAVLEKLAGMELPPCYALVGKEDRVVTETFVMEGTHYKKVFTEEQMRQAYAQGAASQLSAEPVGEVVQGLGPRLYRVEDRTKWGTPLYTLKTAK